jgi:hypothetical protein
MSLLKNRSGESKVKTDILRNPVIIIILVLLFIFFIMIFIPQDVLINISANLFK